MKSYLRFLSRNKLYTAIEVVGLSVSLAFVILMSAYVIGNMSYDSEVQDKDKIFICHNIGGASSYSFLADEFTKYPEIRESCQFGDTYIRISFEGETMKRPLWVSDNFFEFFPYKLVTGKASEVLKQEYSAVVSESLAESHFTEESPIGKTLEFEYGDTKGFLIITGVFKDVKKSNIISSDILINQELMPSIQSAWYQCVNFVRFNGNPDKDQLAHDIYYNSTDLFFTSRVVPELKFTNFNELDINIGTTEPFKEIGDLKQQRRFTTVCVILLLFSLLNYIFLTLAFSRFRLKEMATRMFLGTSRSEIIRRIITESLLLTTISYATGAMIAVALENPVSLLIRSNLEVFGNAAEIVWGAAIIVLCSIVAGIVPALNMTTLKPIEVLKGENRKNDKMLFGKAFIAIQTGICITIISIASAMYLQVEKIIDAPLGYRTKGLIEVIDAYDDVDLYNILKELPCVRSISRISGCPIRYTNERWSLGIHSYDLSIPGYVMQCDSAALHMFGIDIIEKYDNEKYIFFTQSSLEKIEALFEDNGIDKNIHKYLYAGIVSDFKFGNSTITTDGATCIEIKDGERLGRLLIEVEGDLRDAEDMISEVFYEAMGDRYNGPESIMAVSDMIEESFVSERNSCMIIGAFALLCILLTVMAMTALSGYYAHIRIQDTAVRKVFGFSRRDVFLNTVWGFICPVLAGSIFAVPLAYIYVGHWLESFIIRIPNSPFIYIGSIVFVGLVTLAAVSAQAIRLMRTNPAEALKKE